MKLNVTQLEGLNIAEIGKRTDRKNTAIVIDPLNHFEIQAYGKTLDIVGTHNSAIACYFQCGASDKVLYQIKGGKRCILHRKLG